MSKIIGKVEILRDRVYPLDAETLRANTQVVVKAGSYPLYQDGDSYFWLMDGFINKGGARRVGDGMIISTPGDEASDIPVKFPSRTYGPEEFNDLFNDPTFIEGHDEQRLRITLKEGVSV